MANRCHCTISMIEHLAILENSLVEFVKFDNIVSIGFIPECTFVGSNCSLLPSRLHISELHERLARANGNVELPKGLFRLQIDFRSTLQKCPQVEVIFQCRFNIMAERYCGDILRRCIAEIYCGDISRSSSINLTLRVDIYALAISRRYIAGIYRDQHTPPHRHIFCGDISRRYRTSDVISTSDVHTHGGVCTPPP
jgi:hypothetical protein